MTVAVSSSGHVDTMLRIQHELGARVGLQAYSEDNIFTLESNVAGWPFSRIEKEYGLEDHRTYHQRSTDVQMRVRAESRATVPDEAHGR